MHLSIQEWSFLSDLIKNGYPLRKALQFLGKDVTILEKKLERGEDISVILLEHQKGRLYDHLRFFIRISTIADAIACAIHLLQFEKGLQKKFFKKSMYPLFILLFAYIMLLFFTTFIIPQMLTSFDDENKLLTLRRIIHVMQIGCTLFALTFCIFAIVIVYLQKHKRIQVRVLHNIHPYIPLLKDYNSYIFSGYLKELESQGVSTKKAMQYLKDVRKNSLFTVFIKEVSYKLEQGENIYHIFQASTLLNKSFNLAFQMGSSTGCVEKQLTTFMLQQEHIWETKIKRLSIFIQCISYTFVGLVVFIMYQIMLLPLSMLETM